MIQTCPKCGKKGQFSYFEEPDGIGVVGMISHKTGKIKTVHTPLGDIKEPEVNRCFLTLKELQSTDWFADFLKEREKAFEEYKKQSQDYFDKLYASEYRKQVAKENEQ